MLHTVLEFFALFVKSLKTTIRNIASHVCPLDTPLASFCFLCPRVLYKKSFLSFLMYFCNLRKRWAESFIEIKTVAFQQGPGNLVPGRYPECSTNPKWVFTPEGSCHSVPTNSRPSPHPPNVVPGFQLLGFFKRNLKPVKCPYFKKLTQLFLKRYIGQQNMSAGCQFVTCVLKQDRCSLTASLVFPLQTCFPASPLRALSLLTLALGIYSSLPSASWILPGKSLQQSLPFISDWPHIHVARVLPLLCLT